MVDKEDQLRRLYEDAVYLHLKHNEKKVIRNQYGLFWRK
jgi:hypothetical protein